MLLPYHCFVTQKNKYYFQSAPFPSGRPRNTERDDFNPHFLCPLLYYIHNLRAAQAAGENFLTNDGKEESG